MLFIKFCSLVFIGTIINSVIILDEDKPYKFLNFFSHPEKFI